MDKHGATAISDTEITVEINGQTRQLSKGCTIAQLLIQLDVNTTGLAVEINSEIRTGSEFASTTIKDSDKIEIVSLAGGG